MNNGFKIALGLGALMAIVALLMLQPGDPATGGLPAVTPAARLSAVAPAARRDVDYAAFDRRLEQLMAKPGMVGLAVGIVENGRITFLKGYGETHAGSGDPVTPDTVFRWASVSKGVAATMVAKLAEDGKLNLNAPVAQYAADLKLPGGNEHRATVADLLSHRLGLYRNAYDNKLEEGIDPSLLRRNLRVLNSICAPGTCWSYQNVAFDASSEIVSKVTGLPYEIALRRDLFNPLGMGSASVSMPALMANKSWARPHNAGRQELPMVDTYYKVPGAGGVNSNIKDMSLWMLAQMGESPQVLDDKLLATIHAPYVKTPTERGRLRAYLEHLAGAWYGFGWRSYDYAGHRLVGHRGGINGYRSLILFDPQRKSGVVALWNSNSGQPGGLEFEVVDQVYHLPFRDWLKLDGSATSPAPQPTVVDDAISSGAP